jgi:hypothetical protein
MKTLEMIDETLHKFILAKWKYQEDFQYPHTCRYMLEDIEDIIHYLVNVKCIITQDEEHAYHNLMGKRIDFICEKTDLELYYTYCIECGLPAGFTFSRIVNIEHMITIIEWVLNIQDFDLGSML